MLASLAAGGGRGAAAGGAGAGGMRELDAEAPVIWPAWCYSAESGVVGSERARAAAAAAAARRCAREPTLAPPPQQAPSPLHAQQLQQLQQLPLVSSVKSERLSPHNHDNRSSASRSRSVTPSSSSHPGTPPERDASPAAPAAVAPARNYSDIMRSLAARYNHQAAGVANHTDFFHPARANGFPSLDARLGLGKVTGSLLAPTGSLVTPVPAPTSVLSTGVPTPARTSPVCPESDQLVGGIFAGFPSGNIQQRVPAFPVMMDMSSTKTLLALAKLARSSGSPRARDVRRHKRMAGVPDHSPLDLSAGAELAKRARRSSASSGSRASSPRAAGTPRVASPRDDERRSDTESRDERSGESSGGGTAPECECSATGGCERLAAWNVDDVCEFVQSIDICAEYAPNFREQRIDGSGLPLLTEEHLTGMLHMKLGPALKLQAILRKRLSSCRRCASPAAARVNGGAVVKSEPNSQSNSPS